MEFLTAVFDVAVILFLIVVARVVILLARFLEAAAALLRIERRILERGEAEDAIAWLPRTRNGNE